MATPSPFRSGFADLSAAQALINAQKLQNAQQGGGFNQFLGSLGQGFQQGQDIVNLPEAIQQKNLNDQIAAQTAANKLLEAQRGSIMQAGNNIVRINPQTGQAEVLFQGTSASSGTPESFQFAGTDVTGNPVVFSPRSGAFRSGTLPEGVTGILPRTQAPETKQFQGFDAAGNPIQFGSSSGLSQAPVQGGLNLTGPLAPKTQPKLRKSVLLQDENGIVRNDVLEEGEEVPKGSKMFSTPTATDEDGLRKEFLSNQVVKDFTDIAPQYQRIQQAQEEAKTSKNFTAIDQTLINTFNRILDPKSVVRETEYARTKQDQAIWQQLKGQFDKDGQLFVGGAGLSAETRDAMARMAKRFYDTSQSNYTQTSSFYSNIARSTGRDPSLVIPPIGGFQFQATPPQGGSVSSSVATPGINPAAPAPVRPADIRKKFGF